MRICIEKTTGKLIESQSGGETHPDPSIDDAEYAQQNLDTLLQNAINAGYAEDDVEVKFVSDEEFAVIMEKQRESELTHADRRRAEYPPMVDYIDGVVKSDQAQIEKYIADCLAVKEKYPK